MQKFYHFGSESVLRKYDNFKIEVSYQNLSKRFIVNLNLSRVYCTNSDQEPCGTLFSANCGR